VIFSSFIFSRSARRDEAAAFAPERADDRDFLILEEAIDEEARFTFPVRPADEDCFIEYSSYLVKVDTVFAQVDEAFPLVPLEQADARK
jgi:hypothetical protein